MLNFEDVKELRASTANRFREKWPEDERAMLEEMYHDGVGITEMAVHFHRTEIAIFNQLYTMGLFQRVYESRERAEKCKCPKCAYYAQCHKDGCPQCAIHKE